MMSSAEGLSKFAEGLSSHYVQFFPLYSLNNFYLFVFPLFFVQLCFVQLWFTPLLIQWARRKNVDKMFLSKFVRRHLRNLPFFLFGCFLVFLWLCKLPGRNRWMIYIRLDIGQMKGFVAVGLTQSED